MRPNVWLPRLTKDEPLHGRRALAARRIRTQRRRQRRRNWPDCRGCWRRWRQTRRRRWHGSRRRGRRASARAGARERLAVDAVVVGVHRVGSSLRRSLIRKVSADSRTRRTRQQRQNRQRSNYQERSLHGFPSLPPSAPVCVVSCMKAFHGHRRSRSSCPIARTLDGAVGWSMTQILFTAATGGGPRQRPRRLDSATRRRPPLVAA